MKLKHLMYILAASLMLFSVSVPATAAIAKEQTASPAANQTDGSPPSPGGGVGRAPASGGGYTKPTLEPKPKPKSNKGKKGKKKSKKKKKKKKTKAQKYKSAKKKGKKVKGNDSKKVSKKGDSNLPKTGKKYSSKDLIVDGKVKQRRYYGKNGKAELDIDYFHALSKSLKKTVKFPHRHKITWKNGKMKREGH
ncbi:Uncharacterised protein [Listeria grayi]|uniref:hypothetical protein n=1 Tax=Listeria grayi TaxID=1641 RepID=UPI000F6B69F6|nr:hypothetical protein [Listeria grayi]VEI33595.1 Uncharacterised protein [Listeria grayi]